MTEALQGGCGLGRFEDIYYMDARELRISFPLLAEGASRDVYDISSGYVIKVATCRDGDHQCRMEDYVFKRADSGLRRYLCPVLWYKRGMVVMPRAIPVVPLERVIGDPAMDLSAVGPPALVNRDLERLSEEYGLLYGDLLSATSWGVLNNRYVLVDYGCTG
jgi:hypothetical protein